MNDAGEEQSVSHSTSRKFDVYRLDIDLVGAEDGWPLLDAASARHERIRALLDEAERKLAANVRKRRRTPALDKARAKLRGAAAELQTQLAIQAAPDIRPLVWYRDPEDDGLAVEAWEEDNS